MPKNWRRPVERSLASSKLAVFSVYFNPLNWVSRKCNYLEFAAALKGKADLFTVELSFSSEFFFKTKRQSRGEFHHKKMKWSLLQEFGP